MLFISHYDINSGATPVAGPFADIAFKGDPRAAVLRNGSTPGYFVGHVDEFDWNWIRHQRLLVKPGTYHVIVTREGNTIWSGPVTARAGQQVTVDLDRNGAITTKDWKAGLQMAPQPRFHAGVASPPFRSRPELENRGRREHFHHQTGRGSSARGWLGQSDENHHL